MLDRATCEILDIVKGIDFVEPLPMDTALSYLPDLVTSHSLIEPTSAKTSQLLKVDRRPASYTGGDLNCDLTHKFAKLGTISLPPATLEDEA